MNIDRILTTSNNDMLMNKELDFVARYYRKGTLDVGKAYRRTLEKAGGGHPSGGG